MEISNQDADNVKMEQGAGEVLVPEVSIEQEPGEDKAEQGGGDVSNQLDEKITSSSDREVADALPAKSKNEFQVEEINQIGSSLLTGESIDSHPVSGVSSGVDNRITPTVSSSSECELTTFTVNADVSSSICPSSSDMNSLPTSQSTTGKSSPVKDSDQDLGGRKPEHPQTESGSLACEVSQIRPESVINKDNGMGNMTDVSSSTDEPRNITLSADSKIDISERETELVQKNVISYVESAVDIAEEHIMETNADGCTESVPNPSQITSSSEDFVAAPVLEGVSEKSTTEAAEHSCRMDTSDQMIKSSFVSGSNANVGGSETQEKLGDVNIFIEGGSDQSSDATVDYSPETNVDVDMSGNLGHTDSQEKLAGVEMEQVESVQSSEKIIDNSETGVILDKDDNSENLGHRDSQEKLAGMGMDQVEPVQSSEQNIDERETGILDIDGNSENLGHTDSLEKLAGMEVEQVEPVQSSNKIIETKKTDIIVDKDDNIETLGHRDSQEKLAGVGMEQVKPGQSSEPIVDKSERDILDKDGNSENLGHRDSNEKLADVEMEQVEPVQSSEKVIDKIEIDIMSDADNNIENKKDSVSGSIESCGAVEFPEKKLCVNMTQVEDIQSSSTIAGNNHGIVSGDSCDLVVQESQDKTQDIAMEEPEPTQCSSTVDNENKSDIVSGSHGDIVVTKSQAVIEQLTNSDTAETSSCEVSTISKDSSESKIPSLLPAPSTEVGSLPDIKVPSLLSLNFDKTVPQCSSEDTNNLPSTSVLPLMSLPIPEPISFVPLENKESTPECKEAESVLPLQETESVPENPALMQNKEIAPVKLSEDLKSDSLTKGPVQEERENENQSSTLLVQDKAMASVQQSKDPVAEKPVVPPSVVTDLETVSKDETKIKTDENNTPLSDIQDPEMLSREVTPPPPGVEIDDYYTNKTPLSQDSSQKNGEGKGEMSSTTGAQPSDTQDEQKPVDEADSLKQSATIPEETLHEEGEITSQGDTQTTTTVTQAVSYSEGQGISVVSSSDRQGGTYYSTASQNQSWGQYSQWQGPQGPQGGWNPGGPRGPPPRGPWGGGPQGPNQGPWGGQPPGPNQDPWGGGQQGYNQGHWGGDPQGYYQSYWGGNPQGSNQDQWEGYSQSYHQDYWGAHPQDHNQGHWGGQGPDSGSWDAPPGTSMSGYQAWNMDYNATQGGNEGQDKTENLAQQAQWYAYWKQYYETYYQQPNTSTISDMTPTNIPPPGYNPAPPNTSTPASSTYQVAPATTSSPAAPPTPVAPPPTTKPIISAPPMNYSARVCGGIDKQKAATMEYVNSFLKTKPKLTTEIPQNIPLPSSDAPSQSYDYQWSSSYQNYTSSTYSDNSSVDLASIQLPTSEPLQKTQEEKEKIEHEAKRLKLDDGSSEKASSKGSPHLWVGNLPAGTKAAEVRDLLSNYGKRPAG